MNLSPGSDRVPGVAVEVWTSSKAPHRKLAENGHSPTFA